MGGRAVLGPINPRLGRRLWRDWMGGRAVLEPIKGLADVFKGIGLEAELFWDLWRARSTCLKGLDGRPTCYGTYQRLGRRVWRDWMRGRAVLGLMEGLADEFEGIGWEPDEFWDLWRDWPTCLKGLDGRPTCYETYDGLGRCVWRGWMEADVLWWAWPTCLKGLDERPACYGTDGGLGRRVWRGWMGSQHVLTLMILLRKGLE